MHESTSVTRPTAPSVEDKDKHKHKPQWHHYSKDKYKYKCKYKYRSRCIMDEEWIQRDIDSRRKCLCA
jgi:hypothetical protein